MGAARRGKAAASINFFGVGFSPTGWGASYPQGYPALQVQNAAACSGATVQHPPRRAKFWAHFSRALPFHGLAWQRWSPPRSRRAESLTVALNTPGNVRLWAGMAWRSTEGEQTQFVPRGLRRAISLPSAR